MSGSLSWDGVKGAVDGTSSVIGSIGECRERQNLKFEQVRALDTEIQAPCDLRGTTEHGTRGPSKSAI